MLLVNKCVSEVYTWNILCIHVNYISQITYDDICKTYGGSTTSRGYYSSAFARWTDFFLIGSNKVCFSVNIWHNFSFVFSSSTNAYMLMYRQIDKQRNRGKQRLLINKKLSEYFNFSFITVRHVFIFLFFTIPFRFYVDRRITEALERWIRKRGKQGRGWKKAERNRQKYMQG